MAAERDRQHSEQADAGRAEVEQNTQMRAARRDSWLPALLVSGIFLVLGVLVLLTMHFVVRSLYEVRRLTGHQAAVTSVAVTPDGRYVVSGSEDQTVRVWELATGKEVRRLTGHLGDVESVAVTPDGRYILSGGDDTTLRLWELATGEEIRLFAGHEGHVRSVAVTPDGRYVVSGSWDRTVRIWELATGKEVRRLTGHLFPVESVAVTPDGRYILSGGDDATLRVWDLATGNQVQQLRGSDVPVIGIAATLDGRYVVSVGSTAKHFGDVISNVAVWACDSWNVVWRATPDITFGPLGVPTFGAFRAPAVTPDGRYVVVAKFGSPVRRAVLVWELATGNEVRRFETDKQFYCLAVTPDGRYLVCGCEDGTVRVWYLGYVRVGRVWDRLRHCRQ
jgi:WD40 repeat protein